MLTATRIAMLAAAMAILPGCSSDDDPVPAGEAVTGSSGAAVAARGESTIRFSDMAATAGISLTPDNGEQTGHCAIVETLGSGVAIVDIDGDTWPDLLFAMGGALTKDERIEGSTLRLLRNHNGETFADCSDVASVDSQRLYSHGLFATDYDQDGWPDVLITGYGGVLLYHNQGDGTFQEVAAEAGIQTNLWATGAAWGDMNGDGLDDLYVANYVDWSFSNHPVCEGFSGERDVCSPASFDAQNDIILTNLGNGKFRPDAGSAVPVDPGKGLAVLAGDVDLDGDVDLYVANDTTPNFLFLNDGTGVFQEAGIASGTAFGSRATADGSMGVELADLTLNGRPDIWVTNYEHQNFALYRNDAPGVYQHVSDRIGVSAVGTVYVGFGTAAADLDLDGDEDIIVANGHVMQQSRNSPLRQLPLLFRNEAGKAFDNVAESAGSWFQTPHRGRGVAIADLNRDGSIDVVITHCNEPTAVLKNDTPPVGRLASVRLVGVTSARNPVGAALQLKTDRMTQFRCVRNGNSFLSTSEPLSYFALLPGDSNAELTVNWPAGSAQNCGTVKAGNVIIVEGRPPVSIPK
jgi:enediyne biosynthesis protein E4